MFRLARLSLRNRAVVALATIAITIGGVFSLGSLKQELIPSLEIPMAAVVATYPGASAAIVEDQVATPVESAIRSVAGIESIDTTSMNSVAFALVSFRYGTNMDTTNQKLSTAVTRLAPDLPDGVETQVWTGSMDDFPVIQLAVSSAGDGPADRGELAQAVDQVLVPRLSQLEGVRSVDVSGYEAQQIEIALDSAALATAGVSASAVADVLRNNGLAFPAGSISEGERTLTAQLGSPLTSIEELASLPLVTLPDAASAASSAPSGSAVSGQAPAAASASGDSANDPTAQGADTAGGSPTASGTNPAAGDGSTAGATSAGDPTAQGAGTAGGGPTASVAAPVLLSDVATVTLGQAAATSYARMDGRDAVAIAVTKTPDANTVEISHAVTDQVDELAEALEAAGLTVDVAFDQAPFIEDSVAGLAEEGMLGLVFAVIVILVFLVSLRSTLVSAVSIPLSLLVAFITMQVTGETLNMITLGALTITIGRVVDDSIVVIE
ncbi:MAG: efflux RND transporter permease subunit, partial [Bifidobacteriaceae bacterium]|nr:efflux RND transporter permease subunit [Bifidobacteriaceae bacterium]